MHIIPYKLYYNDKGVSKEENLLCSQKARDLCKAIQKGVTSQRPPTPAKRSESQG